MAPPKPDLLRNAANSIIAAVAMDLQSPHGPPRLSLHTRITDLPVEDTCRSILMHR
ncbi:hypothetical protein OROMI_032613 [Orobanche minor]